MNHPASPSHPPRSNRRRGLSLVELLVALSITASLLTATMVAIDASFKSYTIAAESAGTQTATRLTMHRLLTLIRTSTAHGPASTEDDATVSFGADNLASHDTLIFLDPDGNIITLEYEPSEARLYVTQDTGSGTPIRQPILGGVTSCTFHIKRSNDTELGHWAVTRASVDLTVQPDMDTSLSLEGKHRLQRDRDGEAQNVNDASLTPPVRLVASTMPRNREN